MIGKILILVGGLLILMGILLLFKVPIPLGRLPGDVIIKGKYTTIYFPIMSCLILSIVLSFLYYLFFKI